MSRDKKGERNGKKVVLNSASGIIGSIYKWDERDAMSVSKNVSNESASLEEVWARPEM